MNIDNVQKVSLDFYTNKAKFVRAKQYDKNSRFLNISCTNKGSFIKFDPNKVRCHLKMLTPNNKSVYKEQIINDDGTITVEFTENMLASSGKAKLELDIFSKEEEKMISTMILDVLIEPSVYEDDAIEASDEFSALVEMVLEGNKLILDLSSLEAELREAVAVKLESEPATDFKEASTPEFQKKINDYEQEVSQLSESIVEISEVLEMPYVEKTTKKIQYPSTRYIENITLNKGVTYKISASVTGLDSSVYLRLKKSNGVQLAQVILSSTSSEKNTTYTATDTITGCYIESEISSVSILNKDLSVIVEDVSTPNEIQKLNTSVENVNLCINNNYRNIESVKDDNKFINVTNGNIGTLSGYVVHYRNVKKGEIYSIDTYTQGGAGAYTFHAYSGEKITVPNTQYDRNTNIKDTFIVPSDGVLYVAELPNLEWSLMKLFTIKDASINNWVNCKMNVIGDSIVQGSYGNWVMKVKNKLELSIARNYGIGGCRMSYHGDGGSVTAEQSVVARYANMDNDADIIIVSAGTNDYAGQVPLGEPNTNDITTFNGALNVIMEGLRTKYPDKLVIFTNILHRYNDNDLPISTDAYRNAIEERCNKHHFVFYDSYKYSGFDFIKGYYDHVLTSDGLHPNEKGSEILARKIAKFIDSQ